MNPFEFIKNYMTKGLTPKGIVQNIAGNNPIINNLIDMAEKGDNISDYARKRGLMISSVENIEDYLDNNYERICDDDTTVAEFAYNNPVGTFLITMPRTHFSNKKSVK